MPKDWAQWHRYYDRTDASLVQRLEAVRRDLRWALPEAPRDANGVVRLTTICAGEGRDVLPVLAELDGNPPVEATLIEIDPILAERARAYAAELGLSTVDVRTADAGTLETYRDAPPAHVVTVCGVFGNVSVQDVQNTIAALPALLAPGGIVVWTRGVRDADWTADIRAAFAANGFTEASFTSTPEGDFRIGVHRLKADPVEAPAVRSDARMFTFV
jgi:SAM-dependent methyltransferase